MDNPYESPPGPLPDAPYVGVRLKPSLGDILFLISLVCISFLTHRWYREIHQLLRIHATVLGFVVEAALLAAWGCTLTARRNPTAAGLRFVRILVGIAVAALVAVACCWVLLVTGQRPHGLTLPISVAAGIAATLACRFPRTPKSFDETRRGH